jgi:type 1 fimbriae regulatory protein FimB/type 1 fimbriae regulatory protein FimE
MSTIGFHRYHLIQRLGEAARMPFPLHPHMLRMRVGTSWPTRRYPSSATNLDHKNIQHTVRYTELSPDKFRDFWRD